MLYSVPGQQWQQQLLEVGSYIFSLVSLHIHEAFLSHVFWGAELTTNTHYVFDSEGLEIQRNLGYVPNIL